MWGWGMYVPPQPEPTGREGTGVEDDGFGEQLEAFVGLGFDPLTALALAWNRASPSDVRERYLKHGATHDQVAHILA